MEMEIKPVFVGNLSVERNCLQTALPPPSPPSDHYFYLYLYQGFFLERSHEG